MSLPDFLIISIAIALSVVATIFLFMPQLVPRLEQKLNSPWGEREIIAIRLGMSGEDRLEKVLNRPVLNRHVYWDGWARRYPRITGLSLYVLVAILLQFAMVS